VKPSDLLPGSDHYTAGKHPGTGIWRHARTPLTPAYPRWAGEGMTCDKPTCDGKLTTYKLCPTDTGLDTLEDWAETTSNPIADSYAGDWICSGCFGSGPIAVREVQQARNDVPRRPSEDNVVPLFGPRGYDDAGECALRAAAEQGPGHWTGEDAIDWAAETTGPLEGPPPDGHPGVVDLRSARADRLSPDGLDDGPGLAPGGTARRAGRADLLGVDDPTP